MLTAPHRRFSAVVSRAEAEFDGPFEVVTRRSTDGPKLVLGTDARAAYVGYAQAAR
ncbi:hypothetical protein [Streptomyces wuyuanensis]|uniref:hypothetical protein n=1 Tax=Streptomyces wuyuanensis TaxID=1196353 RepID=UPI003801929D